MIQVWIIVPPYQLKYYFDYDDNTIIFYSYCYDFDGEECEDYAVRILRKNTDGTLTFDSGFADLKLSEPTGDEDYYFFTNIDTEKGRKSISFLYLQKNFPKEIYMDGIKANKIPVSIENQDFYLCYVISKQDTFLSNLILDISQRHKIEVKEE